MGLGLWEFVRNWTPHQEADDRSHTPIHVRIGSVDALLYGLLGLAVVSWLAACEMWDCAAYALSGVALVGGALSWCWCRGGWGQGWLSAGLQPTTYWHPADPKYRTGPYAGCHHSTTDLTDPDATPAAHIHNKLIPHPDTRRAPRPFQPTPDADSTRHRLSQPVGPSPSSSGRTLDPTSRADAATATVTNPTFSPIALRSAPTGSASVEEPTRTATTLTQPPRSLAALQS